MAAKFALYFGLISIAVFLYYDYKKNSKGYSLALIIPLLWVIVIGSRSPAEWLNPTKYLHTAEQFAVQSNFINKNFYLVLISLGILVLIRRKVNINNFINNNKWICIYLGYCLISLLWSDEPFTSFKRWFKVLGHIVMILILFSEKLPLESIKKLIRTCGIILVPLSIIFIKYFPFLGRKTHRYSYETIFVGVTTNKNTLGHLCLFLGLFFVWNIALNIRNKSFSKDKIFSAVDVLILSGIIWLFFKASSDTSFICFIIGTIFIIYNFKTQSINKTPKLLTISVYTFLCISPLLFLSSQNFFSSIIDFIQLESDTFWGRINLWTTLLDFIKNPILGYGYDSFWTGERGRTLLFLFEWGATEAHNGYLEIILNLGIIGLFFLSAMIFASYRKIKASTEDEFGYYIFRKAFIYVALTYNIMEAAFRGMHLMWFALLLVCINLPLTKKA